MAVVLRQTLVDLDCPRSQIGWNIRGWQPPTQTKNWGRRTQLRASRSEEMAQLFYPISVMIDKRQENRTYWD